MRWVRGGRLLGKQQLPSTVVNTTFVRPHNQAVADLFCTYPAHTCSGAMVLTCGKDNLLRCVDLRRFEVRCSPLPARLVPACMALLSAQHGIVISSAGARWAPA